MNYKAANIQAIDADWLLPQSLSLDILRLDKIHPVISGNKWFKLQYYLQEAQNEKQTVVTFGGAWSNHIVATAFACREMNIASVGIIRGEAPAAISPTLQSAMDYGMQLHFISREEYKQMNRAQRTTNDKEQENKITQLLTLINSFKVFDNFYLIPDGGYGSLGAQGAAGIGIQYDLSAYTHIVAGVGTGTMLAGLILRAKPDQQIIGISAMKSNDSLQPAVEGLIKHCDHLPTFKIFHDYHFGGFGKHPPALIDFMNEVYRHHRLPLDIVYTAKVFFAVKDLVTKKYFQDGAKVLMIHSGGLQGNESVKLSLQF